MPDTPSFQDRIKTAHEAGHLFAHMFESSLEADGPEGSSYPLKRLFDVMAKKPDTIYKNKYEHEFPADQRQGIKGLATTALKREHPISLYIMDSGVGLMMDSAKPLLVNPSDGFTKVSPTDITFSIRDEVKDHFKSVFDAQNISETTMIFPAIDLSDETMAARSGLAEKGLQALWRRLGEISWGDAEQIIGKRGMNEVNVAATLNDVCGIIVHKNQAAADQPNELGIMRSFAGSLRAAVALKAYLIENYPAFFNASLPIVSYEISRSLTGSRPKMEVLDKGKIQEILSIKGVAKA